jgi:hypothetical protein
MVVRGGCKPSTPDGIWAAMDTESKRQAPLIKEKKEYFCKYDRSTQIMTLATNWGEGYTVYHFRIFS